MGQPGRMMTAGSGSKMRGSKMTRSASKMSGSKLVGSKMTGSKMTGSKMVGSKITGSKMTASKMVGSESDPRSQPVSAFLSDKTPCPISPCNSHFTPPDCAAFQEDDETKIARRFYNRAFPILRKPIRSSKTSE